ncbi:primosomal protein N' [Campylobacter sp. MIT 99-7217]|uniref:primosomal protein N' n=1 Tax=Campylobacter sp. MIT 99-7217 TaxID=535091 RepID=UPI001156EC70|nr:primosomal protein N' [Campylobacter sp. MIT 99-7217]TQR30654.1 primosomal protein N' [Campylobacter sp. MIT 99-7217]
MNYYELALQGYHLQNLVYESELELEELSEVLVDLANKKNIPAIVLKKCQKPKFNTKVILESTDKSLSKEQFELASFISYYYTCSLGFVLGFFETSKKYECKKITKLNKPTLSKDQEKALEFIKTQQSSLLFADTGSGKTEIYITLIKECLEEGKQALFLMPEIALSSQISKRLNVYFKDHFFLWHSKITKPKKKKSLESLENGDIALIVGARSALFLPFSNLGLIIVDEEHESSYKANNNPRFNARDLALFLGSKTGARVVLGSATPSLTSFYKQPSFRLKGTFFESKKEFIFDENELCLSSTILREIRRSLRAKKQAVIFLPTRANFRQIMCQNCGQSIKCPFCSISLSLHKNKNALKCHYCGFSEPLIKLCPHCQGSLLEARKMGTAELVKLLQDALEDEFKGVVIHKFDSDEITSFTKLERILKEFNEGKIQILVGTSMLAKGHDYHSVDLSVILGLDEYLFRPNYKALEESLALAMQVAGRAGRKGDARVLIQTKQRAFFEKYIQDYDSFLQDELEARNPLYPPFSRLLRVIIQDKDKKKAETLCQNIALNLKDIKELEIVGSGACAIEYINAKFRFYVLLRSSSYKALIKASRLAYSLDKDLIIDMDPVDFS